MPISCDVLKRRKILALDVAVCSFVLGGGHHKPRINIHLGYYSKDILDILKSQHVIRMLKTRRSPLKMDKYLLYSLQHAS